MICFCNNTTLDLDAIRAFGVNVKESEDAIGYFGTGLKYAIAICLRNRHAISAWIDGNHYTFGTKTKEIRGKPFDFVTMNGEQLGFTTEVGKSWERWMAFRELYCNMLDEDGSVVLDEPENLIGDYATVVAVEGLEDIWHRRSDYFNMNEHPLDVSSGVYVYPGPCNAIFYKGIRALELKKPTKLMYDIHSKMGLTEERQLKSAFLTQELIENAVIGALDEQLILTAVQAPESFLESEFMYPGYKHPSPTFLKVMQEASKDFRNTNHNAIALYEKHSRKELSEQDARPADQNEEDMLREAINFLSLAGYHISRENVYIIDSLGNGIHGTIRNGKIFITSAPFRKGLREVVMTLLEEQVHIDTGHSDCSRAMQSYLFEQIVDVHARHLGKVV